MGESMAAGKTAPGKATRRGTALAKASGGGKPLGESMAAGKNSPVGKTAEKVATWGKTKDGYMGKETALNGAFDWMRP